MKIFQKIILCAAIFLLLTGCGSTKHVSHISGNMVQNVKEPGKLRVAVLPFQAYDPKKPEKTDYIRKQVFVSLKKGNYDLVERFVMDGVMEKNGWDLAQMRDMSPQRLGEAIGADAIVYGEVTNWNRSYLALQSSITIGVKVKMVDARNGEILWESDYKKTDTDGLSKLPLGMISAALAPILFVTNEDNQYRLADEVSREMMAFFIHPSKASEPPYFKEQLVMASAEKALAEIQENSPEESMVASLFDEELPVEASEIIEEPLESEISGVEQMAAATETLLPETMPEEMASAEPMEGQEQVSEQKAEESSPTMVPMESLFPEEKFAEVVEEPEAEVLAKAESKNSEPSQKGYTIQVGSYRQPESAQHLVGKFQEDGMDAFITQADINGQTWYRVQVNTFESVSEAKDFAMENINRKKMQYFIAPFRPLG